MLRSDLGSVLERASAFLKTWVVGSHEFSRRGAPGGVDPFTDKFASSENVSLY